MLHRFSCQVALPSLAIYVRHAGTIPPSATKVTPSEALKRARSLVDPSVDFPATAGATGADDLRVYWREHWDAQTEKPYYENLNTRITTFEIPEGFPTRFGSYYVRSGHNVINDIVQPRSTTGKSTATVLNTQVRNYSTTRLRRGIGAPPPPDADPSKMTMKQRIALYGTSGLILYLIIHNFILINLFIMLYVFEWDLVSLARNWGFELKFLGGKKDCADGKTSNEKQAEEISSDPSIFATFITAVALCKMMVPVQLTLTLALAPSLAPRINVLVNRWRVWMGYKVPSVTPPV